MIETGATEQIGFKILESEANEAFDDLVLKACNKSSFKGTINSSLLKAKCKVFSII